MRTQTLLTILIALLCTFPSNLFAQCVDGAAGGNPNLIDNGDGTYQIACDGGDVNITSSTYDPGVVPPSAIQWTSGQTGDFVFTPDCTNLGCFQFAPCIPAGTTIPQQCVPFNTLGVPLSGTGSNFNINFNISGICYVPGMTYSGDLGISLGGSGDVSLSVVQPDGVTQGPLTFDIALINDLSPLPLGLLGLDVDPNGNWSILISGGGLTSYSIDPNSNICLDATTTAGVQCGDPIEICVIGGCPSFISAQSSASEICSGGSFTLDATLDPAGAPNVTYQWSGNGIDASNQNSPAPTISLTNNTCNTITETYTLTLTCTNDGSVVASNETVSVTVYPEIDMSAVVIDNTSNTMDPNCSIDISYPPCPGFAITGNTVFTPGDNGTLASYTISNGNPDCDITVTSPVTCIGDCTPATATVVTTSCDAGGRFAIQVTIDGMGDSDAIDIVLSDGSTEPGVTTAGGTYTFGPFSSGTSVNIKLIDSSDPNCNVNLGEYTFDCAPCPNLVSINPIASDVCTGDAISLAANVDSGTEGVDYSIQWFENGVAISGANTAVYAHTVNAIDRCNLSTYTYTAELTCLNGADPSTTTMLSSSSINVYPTPELNVDFVFESCSATPIDNCGGLVINTGGATDPPPGGFTIVNYTVGVAGAPAACQTTGTVTVDCPNCTDYPGNATASETVVCWGESFDLSNINALVASPGYEVGYVVTPNPPSSYPTTSALIAASLNGPNGAFAAPGAITGESYTNNGSLFTPTDACGDLLYFTPFLSFACQSYRAVNISGTVETPAGSDFVAGVYQTPGLGGVTLAVPQVPYSNGLVNYDIQFCANDETDDGAGLFGLCFAGEDPLQENSLFGIIGGLPGGAFSNFPNINDVHDSQQNVCYNQNGWTSNASGEQINVVTVNLQDFCAGGNDNDFMTYDFIVDVNCNSTFPTLCPDCDVAGASVAVRFLPQVTLATIPASEAVCEGDAVDLFALNPATSIAANGKYTWYEGSSSANVVVSNPAAVTPPVGTTQYCVTYSYCETGDCVLERCTNINVNPSPTLAAPVLGPVCPGTSFDLTSVESNIATGGTISWSINDAPIADPTNVIAIGSEQYCATFTNTTTGCENTVCSTFTYETLPTLLAAAPVVCENGDLELTDSNTDLTTDAGTFVWYDGNPATGGNVLASTAFSPYDPAADGTVFYVEFTDATTGCSAITDVTVTQQAAPVLAAPAATICEGDVLSLTALNSSVTINAGTFVWYNGDPTAGGTVIANPAAVNPVAGDMYCVEFTDAATLCADYICFTPTINALPVTTDFAPPPFCADSGPYDITQYESSLGTGDYTWYDNDPAAGGMTINGAAVPQANGTSITYWFELTDPITSCSTVSNVAIDVVNPVAGATAVYDCDADVLVVDLTTATGGTGPYSISPTSPNTNGETIANGSPFSVLVIDANGCEQALIQDVVDCTVCEATSPQLSADTGDCDEDPDGSGDNTPFIFTEDVSGNTIAPYITEYIVIEESDSMIVGVYSTLAAAQAAANDNASNDPNGTGENTACIITINHDSDNLAAVIQAIDDQAVPTLPAGTVCNLAGGCPVTTLEAFYNGISGLASLDLATVVAIVGAPEAGNTGLDLGALLGLPAGILVVDVPPFCYALGNEVCVTAEACACKPLDLTITFDERPDQTTWEITDASGAVVFSGGPYNNPADNLATIVEPVCLPDGCYDLTFFDSANDGMCPRRVSTITSIGISSIGIGGVFNGIPRQGAVMCGNYNLACPTDGTTLASGGGRFGSAETSNFCLPIVPLIHQNDGMYQLNVTGDGLPQMRLLPNVTKDDIMLYYALQTESDVHIQVVDISGKVLQQYVRNSYDTPELKLEVSDLSEGFYFVQLISGDVNMVQKFIKR